MSVHFRPIPATAVLLASALLLTGPGATYAQSTSTPAPAARPSLTKRVVWTIVGAAAGFGAGMYIGLRQFDDAYYAEGKIWATAIVGAAAGAVAGNLLSRDRATAQRAPGLVDVATVRVVSNALPSTVRASDDGLSARVARANARLLLPTAAIEGGRSYYR